MDYLADIRGAFESKGYKPLPNVVVASRGDVWYRHAASTAMVEHILYLSHKPAAKAYSVHVGVFNLDTRVAVAQKLPVLSRFIEPSYLASPFLMERPCWHIFDAGRALKWESVFIIPSPKEPESWPHLFVSLFTDFIERFFFSIRDCNGILELLLRNDPPFEWFLTNPVLRIAEIAALGKIAGVEPSALIGRVDVLSEIISRRLPDVNYRDTINKVFDQLY
jgi:hypothetical protein